MMDSSHNHCKESTLSKKPKYIENQTKNAIFFYACLILSLPLSLALAEIHFQSIAIKISLDTILSLMCICSTVILIFLMVYLFINRYQTFEEAGRNNSKTLNIIYSMRGERVGLYLRFGVVLIGSFSVIYVILTNIRFKMKQKCIEMSDIFFGCTQILFFVTQAIFILKYHSVVILKHIKLIQLGLYSIIFANITTWEMASLSKIIQSVNITYNKDPACTIKHLQYAHLYFLPAVSEYCVIGVAIIYEIMKRLGKPALIETESEPEEKSIFHTISQSIPGVVIAIITVVISVISTITIVVFDTIYHANWVIHYHIVEEILFYIISFVITILAYLETKKLKFSFTFLSNNVDKNLLYLSCFFSIYFSVLILVQSFSSKLDAEMVLRGLTALLEIIQIMFQTFVIQDSFYRCCTDAKKQITKPGQNYLAVLIGFNFGLWVIKSFQLKNGDVFFHKNKQAYKDLSNNTLASFFVYATLPLSILYRYHSSSCLADVYSKIYEDEIDRFEGLLRAEGFDNCSQESHINDLMGEDSDLSNKSPVLTRSKSLDITINETEFKVSKRTRRTYVGRHQTACPMTRRETLQHLETAKLRILSSQMSHNLVHKKLTSTVSPMTNNKDDVDYNNNDTLSIATISSNHKPHPNGAGSALKSFMRSNHKIKHKFKPSDRGLGNSDTKKSVKFNDNNDESFENIGYDSQIVKF